MAPRDKASKQPVRTDAATPSGGPLVAMARGLAEIVAEHGLSELILESKDVTLTVRRGGVGGPVLAAPIHMPAPAALPGAAPFTGHAATPAAPAAPAAPVVDDKSHVVTSPFVGTFYRRPNPDSSAYVSLNERVERGQVLCIVEAMKLMNEIEADVSGTVVAILVEDNQTVEYGQSLFKIVP